MNYHNVVFETSFGKASQLTKSAFVEIAFARPAPMSANPV